MYLLLAPQHIKLGLMKKKGPEKVGSGLKYLKEKFPRVAVAKINFGMFVYRKKERFLTISYFTIHKTNCVENSLRNNKKRRLIQDCPRCNEKCSTTHLLKLFFALSFGFESNINESSIWLEHRPG